ncbi:MAG: MFS transporter [Chitinophagaceae bacterium]|nr:MFS transporter [Chitinophagaceae bacterium]
MSDQHIPAQQTHDRLAAMRIPEYRYLMFGRFTFIMSLRMMSTLVIWWTYQLTKSPFLVGMLGLSEFVPAILMALYSGYIVDRSRKKALLLRCVFCYVACASVLLLASLPFTTERFTNFQIVTIIYAVIFCTGVIRSFTGPCFSSLLATIVPRQLLQNATTWSQSAWLSASVIGHGLGGFLIAWFW